MRARTKFAIGILCTSIVVAGAFIAFRIYRDHLFPSHPPRTVETPPFEENSTTSLPAVQTPWGRPLSLVDLAGDYVATTWPVAQRHLWIQADGTWKQVNSVIFGPEDTSKGTVRVVDGKMEFEVFTSEGKPSGRRCACIPVWWTNRLFLLDRPSLATLCNEINWGILPPHEIIDFLAVDLPRHRIPAAGMPGERMPSLPPEFAAWILERPMKGTIVQVLPDGTAKIDLGANHGAFVGMRLAAETVAGSRAWTKGGNVEVISVQPDSCLVKRSIAEDSPLLTGMSATCPAAGYLLK